jgi:hypothetical protein
VKKGDHLEDLRVNGRIKFILKKKIGGRGWNKMATNWEKWRALVNTAINLWVT